MAIEEGCAETLQVMYHARGEMKSEDCDQYIQHLKMTGEYESRGIRLLGCAKNQRHIATKEEGARIHKEARIDR